MTHPAVDVPADPLATWLAPILAHCGDRRTARTLTGIVAGILGSGSLVCSRIAAFSPSAGEHPHRRTPGPTVRAR